MPKPAHTHEEEHKFPIYVWSPPATLEEFLRSAPRGNKAEARVGPIPAKFEEKPNTDPGPPSGKGSTLVPHPLSDYSHLEDDSPYFKANEKLLQCAPGYRRLETLYTFLLRQIIALLDRINQAKEKSDYCQARMDYANFVSELDDAEFPNGASPGGPGYGRVIKWLYVDPVIENPTGAAARITGVKFVVKWNPHSSSSHVTVP